MIITQKVVIFSRACAILCYHSKNNVQTYAVIQLKAHVHPNGFACLCFCFERILLSNVFLAHFSNFLLMSPGFS